LIYSEQIKIVLVSAELCIREAEAPFALYIVLCWEVRFLFGLFDSCLKLLELLQGLRHGTTE
jgi:hypothetical protein